MTSCFSRIPALSLLVGLLASCGGGSGGSGPSTPTTSPAPPVTKTEAYRFLTQATFGATEAEAQRLIGLGDSSNAYSRWIDDQLAQPASLQLPTVQAAYQQLTNPAQMIGTLNVDRQEIWFRNAVTGQDQLRQRVAFALSEILVVSQQSTLVNMPHALADYYDMLARDAFGNFRKLLEDVTLHPAMGVYLSMLGNQKADPVRNIQPDENYAREVLQLFSTGLVLLNIDGSVRKDAQGEPLPTYDQEVIEDFAHVYTGWNYAGAASFTQARRTLANQVQPMQAYAEQHSTISKTLLSYSGAAKTVLPAGQTAQQDLKDGLDNIFNHPNVGPFIAKQLIQRLVTSNPSPQYVERVARKFNDDGTGTRGNLGAVIRAILLDTEARTASTGPSATKLKEPLLRLTQLWRAYDAKAANGRYVAGNVLGTWGQGPLQAGSVFNFFSPSYAPTGEIADQGLVSPEMQLATEYLNTTVTNALYAQVFGRNSSGTGLADTAIVIDIRTEVGLAGDSEALVNKIADKLLGGQISASLKAEAKAAAERFPATSPTQRVTEALYLIVTSPEFALQR